MTTNLRDTDPTRHEDALETFRDALVLVSGVVVVWLAAWVWAVIR